MILVCGSWLCLVSTAKLRGPFGGFQWIVVPIRHIGIILDDVPKYPYQADVFDHFWMLNMSMLVKTIMGK